jgi:hypothetical protein
MPDIISIAVNAESAQAYIDRKGIQLRQTIGQKIDVVNAMFADRVRNNLSGEVLKRVTGKLFDTVQQQNAVSDGSVVTGSVTAGGPEAPYGIYFEEGGTGYYTIRPVSASVLAFMGEGGMIFAKAVNHPPIPKLPWFNVEMEQARNDMISQMNQAFDEVLGA